MKNVIIILLLGVSILSCTSEPEPYPDSLLDKLLHQEEIKVLLAKYNNTLLVAESAYCQPGICENLLVDVASQIDLKVFGKEDMFMRNIHDYIEIVELRDDYLKVMIHQRNEKQLIEVF